MRRDGLRVPWPRQRVSFPLTHHRPRSAAAAVKNHDLPNTAAPPVFAGGLQDFRICHFEVQHIMRLWQIYRRCVAPIVLTEAAAPRRAEQSFVSRMRCRDFLGRRVLRSDDTTYAMPARSLQVIRSDLKTAVEFFGVRIRSRPAPAAPAHAPSSGGPAVLGQCSVYWFGPPEVALPPAGIRFIVVGLPAPNPASSWLFNWLATLSLEARPAEECLVEEGCFAAWVVWCR